jgi:hypothetical protein
MRRPISPPLGKRRPADAPQQCHRLLERHEDPPPALAQETEVIGTADWPRVAMSVQGPVRCPHRSERPAKWCPGVPGAFGPQPGLAGGDELFMASVLLGARLNAYGQLQLTKRTAGEPTEKRSLPSFWGIRKACWSRFTLAADCSVTYLSRKKVDFVLRLRFLFDARGSANTWLFAPRTKRYDRGAISDLLAIMNQGHLTPSLASRACIGVFRHIRPVRIGR